MNASRTPTISHRSRLARWRYPLLVLSVLLLFVGYGRRADRALRLHKVSLILLTTGYLVSTSLLVISAIVSG